MSDRDASGPDAFPTGLDAVTGAAGPAVDADLHVELTTAAGGSGTARVTGHGQQIRVQAQRLDVLLAAVDRADVGRAADLLAATGLTLTLHGPGGPVATVGAGARSRIGRAVTGSSRVAPVGSGGLRLAWASRPVRTAALAVSAALTALAVLGRHAGYPTRPDQPRSRRR